MAQGGRLAHPCGLYEAADFFLGSHCVGPDIEGRFGEERIFREAVGMSRNMHSLFVCLAPFANAG